MKAIIVSDHAWISGGLQKVAVDTAINLAKRGIGVLVFALTAPVDEGLTRQNNIEVKSLLQYDILTDPNRLRAALYGLYNQKAKAAFGQILEGYDPKDTVIHVHGVFKGLTSAVLSEAQARGFKIICHLHDYFWACPNLAFYHFGKRTACHRQPLSFDCLAANCDARSYAHKLWRCARQFIQTKICGFPGKLDAVIYISQFSYRIMESFLAPPTKRFFLPNCVERSVTERIKAEDNKAFVFVGRLAPEKNPLLLAKAAQKLGVPAIFVGDGILADDIRKANPNAEVTGWVESDKVSGCLKKARCLVFPSVWYECHPLVVVEALQMGIPVITSDGCAATDMVIDGANGFWFQRDDEKSLAEAMGKMLDDETVRRLSESAWRIAASNDDAEAYTDKLLTIYESVLKE